MKNSDAKGAVGPGLLAPQSSAGSEQGVLGRYLTELVEHRVLTPDEEIELAREVQTLEITYWRLLLSEPLAFEALYEAWAPHLDVVPKEAHSLLKLARTARTRPLTDRETIRWQRAADKLAPELRVRDVERNWVQDTHERARQLHRVAPGMRRPARGSTQQRALTGSALKHYLAQVEQARRAQLQVKHRFVAANLRLVVTMARRFRDGRMPLEDVIQEGNFGLLKAVERFDHKLGFRFSTYASWWIRHHITRALADKGRVVRVPVHLLETYQRVTRVRRRLESQTGVTPDDAQVREAAGLTVDQLAMVEEGAAAMSIFSLDVRLGDEEDSNRFVDLLVDEEADMPDERVESSLSSQAVTRLLDTLTSMEAHILRWRFGLDGHEELTLREIGLRYNLSRERIRQIQVQALEKLQRAMRESEDGTYDEPAEARTVPESSPPISATTQRRGEAASDESGGRTDALHAAAC